MPGRLSTYGSVATPTPNGAAAVLSSSTWLAMTVGFVCFAFPSGS